MKKIQFILLFVIAVFAFSSCSKENPINEEATSESKLYRPAGPIIDLVNYGTYCGNGPQVKLRFTNCATYSTFYVNVFRTNGTHVYSWPVDNPYLNANVTVGLGSLPFTYPDGSTTCSLLYEGQTYYVVAGEYSNMIGIPSSDSFTVSQLIGCDC